MAMGELTEFSQAAELAIGTKVAVSGKAEAHYSGDRSNPCERRVTFLSCTQFTAYLAGLTWMCEGTYRPPTPDANGSGQATFKTTRKIPVFLVRRSLASVVETCGLAQVRLLD